MRPEDQQIELVEGEPARPWREVKQRQAGEHDQRPKVGAPRCDQAPAEEGGENRTGPERMMKRKCSARGRGRNGNREAEEPAQPRTEVGAGTGFVGAYTSTSMQGGWPRNACGLALAP